VWGGSVRGAEPPPRIKPAFRKIVLIDSYVVKAPGHRVLRPTREQLRFSSWLNHLRLCLPATPKQRAKTRRF